MKNLYKVKINTYKKGNEFYVVATDSGTAYQTVRDLLDEKDWFFDKERCLDEVKLVAQNEDYPDNEIQLLGV